MVYQYDQLVPVFFGDGAIDLLGEKVKELGCTKVMCVYDGGVKAAGIAPRAEAALKAAGIEYVVYDRIESDPSDKLVDECGLMAKEAGVDGFVAIGGGSSMDCTKAAALLLDHPAPINQYFTAPPSFIPCSVPIVLVPTTSGTGSEVTQVAVITDSRDHSKPSVFTRSSLAIVDPSLTVTVLPSVTANTGLDAFTHAAEAITAKRANPRSELLAKAAIERISADNSKFFIMIEEAHIDKHSHSNDGINASKSVKQLNDVAAYCMSFTVFHPDTALVITADHETGGIRYSSGEYIYTSDDHTAANIPMYACGGGTEVLNNNIINTDTSDFLFSIFE